MKKKPFTFNCVALMASIAVFAQALRIAEAPLRRVTEHMDHYSYINDAWEVVLTMTSVGYGDYYPRTLLGRAIIFVCSMVGVVIVSIVVVSVMNLLQMSSLESKAFTIIKKLEHRSKLKDHAAHAIGKFAKLYLALKNKRDLSTRKIFELSKSLEEFKLANRFYRAERDEN